jgi:hypothetical protein
MSKSLNDLISRADMEIEKRANALKKQASIFTAQSTQNSEETVKIATMLLQEDTDFRSSINTVEPVTNSGVVKIAQALAIVEVLNNFDTFDKIEKFEKVAQEKGFSQDEINEYIVKNLY